MKPFPWLNQVNWLLWAVAIYFAAAVALTALSTAALPTRGNYDEVLDKGLPAKGVVNSSYPESADDEYWGVNYFSYTHDGKTYHGVANNINLPAGYAVDVRYLGNQAVLVGCPPPDFNRTRDFFNWLFFAWGVVMFPIFSALVAIVLFVMWLAWWARNLVRWTRRYTNPSDA